MQGGINGLPSAQEVFTALGFTCGYKVHDRGPESSLHLMSSIPYIAAITLNGACFRSVHLQSDSGLSAMRDVFLEVSSDRSLLPNMLELMLLAHCLSCSTTSGDVAWGSCLVGVPGAGGEGRLG